MMSALTANSLLEKLQEDDQWRIKDMPARWMAVFQTTDLPNMLSIFSYILSIPENLQDGKEMGVMSEIGALWSS